VPSQALQVDAHTFGLLQRRLSASTLIQLKIDGGTETTVMINRLQRDFRTGQLTHLELFQVNMSERLTASVPLVIVDVPEIVRRGDGLVLLQELDTLQVSCLPGDLPASIEVSAQHLQEAGDCIYVRDLVLDRAKIEVRVGEDEPVARLSASQMRAEDVAADAASAAAAAEASAAAAAETEVE